MERVWRGGGQRPYILPLISVSFLVKQRPFLDRLKKMVLIFISQIILQSFYLLSSPTIYHFANVEFYIYVGESDFISGERIKDILELFFP